MNFSETSETLLQENDDARRAQLVAAAEALASWIHTRRATWPDLPDGPPARSGARLADLPGVAPLAPIAEAIRPLSPAPSPVLTGEPEVEGPIEPAAAPGPSWSERLATVWSVLVQSAVRLGRAVAWIAATLLSLLRRTVTPVARVSRRSAAYLATASVLVVGGWVARPYWPMMLARVTPGAEQMPPANEQSPASRAPQSGQLMVRSEPAGARVSVDGKPVGVTPLDVEDLNVGRHTVVIETDQGSVRRTVAIEAGGATLVNESIFAGFLKVFAPFELQITDGGRAIRLDDQNQVMLPPGSYQLLLENTTLGFRETRRVDVNPGQTSTLSIVPAPSQLTVTSNVPATVSIDGAEVGPTPLTGHPIPLGTRDIVVRSQSGEQRRFTRRVTVAPLELVAEF